MSDPIHFGLTHDRQERVYFILVGEHVKIGYTGNLKQRLAHHAHYGMGSQVIGSIPGTRQTETHFHRLAARAANSSSRFELFQLTARLDFAITTALRGTLVHGQPLPFAGT